MVPGILHLGLPKNEIPIYRTHVFRLGILVGSPLLIKPLLEGFESVGVLPDRRLDT